MAYTMTLLMCPMTAWLPTTSVPTKDNYRYPVHMYFQAKTEQNPKAPYFSEDKRNWHISSSSHMCLQHRCPKKGNSFPPPRFLVSPPNLPTVL